MDRHGKPATRPHDVLCVTLGITHVKGIFCAMLSENSLNHFAVHIGQAKVASLETVSQARVIETKQMKNGGVEVVHVHGIFGDVKAEVVGSAVSDSFFDSGAG